MSKKSTQIGVFVIPFLTYNFKFLYLKTFSHEKKLTNPP